jgi:hypothetical protein
MGVVRKWMEMGDTAKNWDNKHIKNRTFTHPQGDLQGLGTSIYGYFTEKCAECSKTNMSFHYAGWSKPGFPVHLSDHPKNK